MIVSFRVSCSISSKIILLISTSISPIPPPFFFLPFLSKKDTQRRVYAAAPRSTSYLFPILHNMVLSRQFCNAMNLRAPSSAGAARYILPIPYSSSPGFPLHLPLFTSETEDHFVPSHLSRYYFWHPSATPEPLEHIARNTTWA